MGTQKFRDNPDHSAQQRVAMSPNEDTFVVSATVAAAANNQAIPAIATKVAYITGFEVGGLGATAAIGVAVTVTGLAGGQLEYTIPVVAGATLGKTPLVISY